MRDRRGREDRLASQGWDSQGRLETRACLELQDEQAHLGIQVNKHTLLLRQTNTNTNKHRASVQYASVVVVVKTVLVRVGATSANIPIYYIIGVDVCWGSVQAPLQTETESSHRQIPYAQDYLSPCVSGCVATILLS